MAWADPTYKYKREITIDSNKVSADETDFAVLVTNAVGLNLDNIKSASGEDVIFYDATETTLLSHDKVAYSVTKGTTIYVAYVKLPYVSSTQDTTFYMYYGKPGVSGYQGGGVATDTWDTDYVAVYHGNTANDSTANGYNYTPYNGAGVNYTAVNKINSCLDLENDNNEYFANSAAYNFGQSPFQANIMAWVYVESISTSGSDNRYVGINCNNLQQQGGLTTGLWIRYLHSGNQKFQALVRDQEGGISMVDSSTFNTGTWYHLSADYTTTSVSYWRDAGSVQTNTGAVTWTDFETDDFEIGRNIMVSTDAYMDAQLEEIRLSKTNRGGDWVTTNYNNQNTPESFMTFGNQRRIVSGKEVFLDTFGNYDMEVFIGQEVIDDDRKQVSASTEVLE